MSQRIFITGVSASLMKGLIDRLLDDGHHLAGLSRKDITIPGVRIIKGDLQDPSDWRHEVANADMIIHAAALTHSHRRSHYFTLNVQATQALLEHCRPDQGFVFISSRTAGPLSGGYGRSKWEAENHIRAHHARHLILSPSEVFGVAKGEGIEGLIQDAMTKRFLPYPAGVRYPMRPIHVDDLCQEMHRLISKQNWLESPVIINGPESMGFEKFFEVISESTGHRPILIPIPAFLMKGFGLLASCIPGVLPFTADQVTRLYAPKEEVDMETELMGLAQYVKGLSL